MSDIIFSPQQDGLAIAESPTKSKMDAFETSAKLCVLRESLIERLSDVNRKIDQSYDDDDSFYNQTLQRVTPNTFDRYAFLYLIFWALAVSVAISTFAVYGKNQSNAAGGAAFIIGTAITLCVRWVISKIEKNIGQTRAKELLSTYQQERAEYDRQLPQWESDAAHLTDEIKRVTDVLSELIHQGGIPHDYWEKAAQLWHLVEIHRAESLKEAINVYEDIQWKMRMIGIAQSTKDEVARMQKRLDSIRQQQIALSNQMTMMQIDQAIDSLLIMGMFLSKKE